MTFDSRLGAQTSPAFSIIVSFTNTNLIGENPAAGLFLGSDGNFYGTAEDGGSASNGTIFRITSAGVATALHEFVGSTDGINPVDALVQGSDGNYYGTSHFAGASSDGTVYRITPTGEFTLLHAWSGTDGSYPSGTLLRASDGNLYGTTQAGGLHGDGTIYRITAAGVFSVFYNFGPDEGIDGEYGSAGPRSGLVEAADGNLYGTTYSGGADDLGTIYRITLAGVPAILHAFTSAKAADGSSPVAGLALGSDGNLYGTTSIGGPSRTHSGTIFRVAPAGVFSIVHGFTAQEASFCVAAMIPGSDGNLYGTAPYGGAENLGTVFQFTPAGVLTVLHSFVDADTEGDSPSGALVQATDGNFYGTTQSGGAGNGGTIFRLAMPDAVQFAAPDASVDENSGNVGLTVQRVGHGMGAATVNYSEDGGTAVAGSDYQVTSGTLSWADGDTTDKTISIPILDHHVSDGECFPSPSA